MVSGQRALSVVHIALLLVALIGASVPPTLERSLRGPIHARYTVALQRDQDALGALAAYAEIRRGFSASPRPDTEPLAAIAAKIHRLSPPPDRSADATTTELHLARRIGRLQGGTRPGGHERATAPDAPIRDARDLRDRLDRLDRQRDRTDRHTERAHLVVDLAARAVASLVTGPGLGQGELVQILREYLGGLIENSPLKRVFFTWATHRPGATRPDAAPAVVPDPLRLKAAALTELKHQLTETPPRGLLPIATNEQPIDGAVDLANEARYLTERTDRCSGCPPPDHLDQHRRDGRIQRAPGGRLHIRPAPVDVD